MPSASEVYIKFGMSYAVAEYSLVVPHFDLGRITRLL
jgi:hypothetical protein